MFLCLLEMSFWLHLMIFFFFFKGCNWFVSFVNQDLSFWYAAIIHVYFVCWYVYTWSWNTICVLLCKSATNPPIYYCSDFTSVKCCMGCTWCSPILHWHTTTILQHQSICSMRFQLIELCNDAWEWVRISSTIQPSLRNKGGHDCFCLQTKLI